MQEFEFAVRLPTSHGGESPFARTSRIRRQRKATRGALKVMAYRPRIPCVVTLIRISSGNPDTDRAIHSLSAVRDEIARWIHELPFESVEVVDGKIRKTVPRAPDGPNDGIEWRYGVQRTKRRGFQGCRVMIEEAQSRRTK